MDQGRQTSRPNGAHVDFESSVESFSFGGGGGLKSSHPTINDPCRESPADVLFLNGRIMPVAYHAESERSRSQSHSRNSSTNSKDSASRSNSNSSSSSGGGSRSGSYTQRRKNSVDNKQPSSNIPAPGTPTRARKAVPPSVELSFRQRIPKDNSKIKKDDSKSWFGVKIFQSFTSACRECHALEPAVKDGTIPRNIKGY
ncbi:hypothetical protein ACHQM5_017250 [Ranunculus cassubicifolius]